MNTSFSHPQQGLPRRSDPPNSSRPRETSATTQRTRVETQYRPPAPNTRPPTRSRHTSPEDDTRTIAPTMPPQRSSGSSGRVYSSPTRPFDRCHSPVMTLRILSPSREGARDGKRRDGRGNKPTQGSPESPSTRQGLGRSTNTKQDSPKRRRLPLRDSMLLNRKSSPDSTKEGTSTSASTPRKPPTSPRQQQSQFGTLGFHSMPSTPCKSRFPDLPRYAETA